ncbi:MAG: M4 family metallopeptidase [Gammaproteobacteria bacterium]|nr:M4 family metallopeptidase [Gammaproteobacteria bacterium]
MTDDGNIVIRVFNGGPQGTSEASRVPVTSADIAISGVSVFLPNDFNPTVSTLESDLVLPAGTHDLTVEIAGEPESRLIIEILMQQPLRAPSEAVRSAAEDLLRSLPGAQIDFGQRTGHIVSVRSAGLSVDRVGEVPIALSESRGTNDTALASALMEFFQRFGYIWGIDNPTDELSVSLRSNQQYDNVGIPDPFDQQSLVNLPVHGLELVNMHQEIRVLGRYVHGVFDPQGNLQVLTTNLEPIIKGLDATPNIEEGELLGLLNVQLPAIVKHYPTLYWLLDGKQPLEIGIELVWLAPQKGSDGLLRLAWDMRLRNGMKRARFWIDAKSGEVLRAIDTSASAWYDEGVVSLQTALDEANNSRTFPTTRFEDRWYMGYGAPYVGGFGPYFTTLDWLQVGNSFGADDRSVLPAAAQEISALGGNRWSTDARFNGVIRAAVSMADNATRVLDWWAGFGWLSWDGRGSTLWTGVNGNRRPDGSPQRNAFGGNGGIHTMDGVGFGYTFAGSTEIIGHEFMHSVIDATTQLAYFGESGAVNEALADLFGSAITGVSDRFNDDNFGEFDFGAGGGLRNWVNPGLRGQPAHYSEYAITLTDSGGVHTNSGILNKAHSNMISGLPKLPGSALGLAQSTELVRAANQFRLFSPNAGLEEFAAAVRGYCRYIQALISLLGRGWPSSHCNAVDASYSSVGLAAFNIDDFTGLHDMAVQGGRWYAREISSDQKFLWLEVRNKNLAGSIQPVEILNIVLTDEVGDSITGTYGGFLPLPCASDTAAIGALGPGASACMRVRFGAGAISGYLLGPRTVDVELVMRRGDSYPPDNILPIRVLPDYTFERASIRNLDPTVARIRSIIFHQLGGFPAELQGRYLVRSGNVGALSTIAEVFTLGVDSPPNCTRNLSPTCDPGLDFLTADVNLLLKELALPKIVVPTATPVPGSDTALQVWMDAQGRLPTSSPGRQFFALIDSSDAAEEGDETNNLMCVNCVPSEDSVVTGIIVRLPLGVPVDSLFPVTVRDAARKLPAGYPRLYEVRERLIPDLNGPIVPGLP